MDRTQVKALMEEVTQSTELSSARDLVNRKFPSLKTREEKRKRHSKL